MKSFYTLRWRRRNKAKSIVSTGCYPVDTNTSSHFSSGMESGVLLEGRPYGGCAVLWSNSGTTNVHPVSSSDRICGITTNLRGLNTLICSVYMPCLVRQNAPEFRDVLIDLGILCSSSKLDSVIIGGDFNIDVKYGMTDQSDALREFMNAHNLKCVSNLENTILKTFTSKANNSSSFIDHFIVSDNLMDIISDYYITEDTDNF